LAYSLITPNSFQFFELDLGDHLGRGATADVYKVSIEGHYYALKIYKKPDDINWAKLKALTELGHDQEFSFVKTHAWPLGIVQKDQQSIGFAMELFDLDSFKTVDHYYDNILRAQISDTRLLALPNLVLIAKNLSLELGKFHQNNIHLIDIKPQNIAINTVTNEVIILDCDGFSFGKDNVHYPADFVSADYIAPEVTINKSPPQTLGLGQDLYALSVLIFQILNRGLHPYSGVSKVEIQVHTNDDKATLGNYYAYGKIDNPAVAPHVSSLHRHWEDNILSALESCFTGSVRTSAADWVQIFEGIEHSKGYVRCDKFQQDSLHIKFRDKECLQCHLDGLQITHTPPQKPSFDPLPPPAPSKPPPTVPKKMSGFAKFLLASILVLIVWAFFKNGETTNARRTTSPVTTVTDTPELVARNCYKNVKFCNKKQLCFLATTTVNGRPSWIATTATFSKYMREAKTRGLTCGVKTSSNSSSGKKVCSSTFPQNCSKDLLCARATILDGSQRKWRIHYFNRLYVQEAKKRGLTCGVKISSNSSSGKKVCGSWSPENCSVEILCARATSLLLGKNKWSEADIGRLYAQEAKKRGLTCDVRNDAYQPSESFSCNSANPDSCTDIMLCGRATYFKSGSRKWQLGSNSSTFVREAKKRKLHCGVTDEKSQYLRNTDFLGNDFNNTGIRGISFAACVDICKGREDCKGISYVDEKKWCWPKRAMNNRSIRSGITSIIIR
jgi:serine/threonine protein kinase